jgi:competence protein ComEC
MTPRLAPAASPGLVANGLGFAAGVGLLFLLTDLPSLPPLLGLALVLGGAAWRWPILRPAAFAGLGLAWAQISTCQVLCHRFPEAYAGQPVTVVGSVAGLPVDTGQATRFLFHVEAASRGREGIGYAGLTRLSWYRHPPDLKAGERWRLRVVLKPPHGFANPGGFDYERWLFLQGITATGHVREAVENQRLGSGSDMIGRWRQGLRDHLEATLKGSSALGLVEALVLGERSALTPDQWEVLTRTGTSHLVAISGLHVGLVAALVFFLARWGWSRGGRLPLVAAAPRVAAVTAVAGALMYSALAGFAVSTQRALIMSVVVLGSLLFSRTLRAATGLVVALVGVLMLDPRAVLSPGFWLSFGAVAVLLYALGRRLSGDGWWGRWGRAQWAVALGLLPMLLLVFGRASLISPLVNLVAVPVFSLVVLPVVLVTSLVSLLPGLELPLELTAGALAWAFDWLESAASWSWAATLVAGRPAWVWAAVFAGALLLLAPRGLPGRWLGLALLLPLPLVRPSVPAAGEAQLTVLDVGQGLSAVVRTRQHTLVYDTGPAFPGGFDTGSAVVLPFLHVSGVERMDTLVLSHGDRDHTGGFTGIAGQVPIARILSGEPSRLPGVHAEACHAGQGWVWDGVRFEVLHPPAAGGVQGNDSSCVLRVATAGASVLIAGDVGRAVESELVRSSGPLLKATILVAAHHGSASSTTEGFLDAVSPSDVLYTTGYANRFGFPTRAVRDRVARVGARELDTASAGAVQFLLGPFGVAGPFSYRHDHRHLWTH